jgi:hypothetical protein
MRIALTERQLSYIRNFIIEQEIETSTPSSTDTTSATAAAIASTTSSSSTSSSGGGSDKPSYPQVSKWESGATRGAGNQIDVTTWEDVVGSKLTRGKSNQLSEQENAAVENKPMPVKTPWGDTINIPEGSFVEYFTDDSNIGEMFAVHDQNGIALKNGTEYKWKSAPPPSEQDLHSMLPTGTVAYFETPNEGHIFALQIKYDAVKTRHYVKRGYFREAGGVSDINLSKTGDTSTGNYTVEIAYKEDDYIPYYKEKAINATKLLADNEYVATENKNIKISKDRKNMVADFTQAHSYTDLQEGTLMMRDAAYSIPGIIIQIVVTVFTEGAAILPIELMNVWFLLNDISILIDNGIKPAPPTNLNFKDAFLWLWRNNEDIQRFTVDLFIVATMGVGALIKGLGGLSAIGAKVGAFIEGLAPEAFLKWFTAAMSGLKSGMSAIVEGAGGLIPQAVKDWLTKSLEFIGVAQQKILAYGAKGTIEKYISLIPKAIVATGMGLIGVETFNWLINYMIPPATTEEKAKELAGTIKDIIVDAKNGDRTLLDNTVFESITNSYPDIKRENFKSTNEIYNGWCVFIINKRRCVVNGKPPKITVLKN